MKLDKFSARNLEDLYRSQLQEIMDEWADHTEDTECGGISLTSMRTGM